MSNVYRSPKGLFGLFMFSALLLLGGCLPSAVNMKPPITSETPINQDGIVIARVIDAGGAMLPFNQLTLTPKDINVSKDKKYSRLEALPDPDGDTTLFASAITPGEYSVDSARSFFVIGEYYYSLWASGGIDLGVFKVSPGKITDLGTFIYYRKVDGDKYTDQLIRVPQTNNQKFIAEYRSFINYNPAEILSWNDDGLDNERFSTYVSLSQNPTIFSKRHLAENSSLYLLGKLGSVLERKASGDWLQHTLETNADLRTIASHQNQLLIGGDQGSLFFKDENAKWHDWSLDIGAEIGGIKFTSSREIELFITEDGKGVILRGVITQGKPQWANYLTYIPKKGWVDAKTQARINTGEPPLKTSTPANLKRVTSLKLEKFLGHDYVRVGIQDSGFDKKFHTLDRTTYVLFSLSVDGQLRYEPELAGDMDSIINAGKTSIGVKEAGFWSLTGKDSYYRYDASGKTWERIDTRIDHCPGLKTRTGGCKINGKLIHRYESFSLLSIPVFVTQEKGYASARSTSVTKQDKKSFMVVTEDGGKNWNKLEVEFPGKFCTDLVPEINDKIMLYCGGVSGDFYESTDEGKTWQHVRQHQNF